MIDQSIYLVRRGRNSLQRDGRIRGLADPDLNAAGLGQANFVGVRFRVRRTFDHRLQSATACGTTAAIIAQSCQTEHKVDVRFNDRDYGRWTGQPKADVIAQWGTVDAAPGVQPTSSILSQAHPALDA